MSRLTRRKLLESTSILVADVSCRAPRSGRSDEEQVTRPQLVVPRLGVFEWHSGGTSVVADGATALFTRAGTRYRVSHPVDGGDECTAVTFAPDAVDGVLAAEGVPAVSSFMPFPDTCDGSFRIAVERLRATKDPLEAEELALHLLLRALRLRHQAPLRASEREPLEAARTILALHFAEPMTLRQLGRAVHMSPFHLSRRFRAYTGASLHQYRMRLRLSAAFERIVETREDVSRIGLDVGFATPSHFAAAFRRCYGYRPGELRSRFGRAVAAGAVGSPLRASQISARLPS
jgi:AraC family transcriptional regulator